MSQQQSSYPYATSYLPPSSISNDTRSSLVKPEPMPLQNHTGSSSSSSISSGYRSTSASTANTSEQSHPSSSTSINKNGNGASALLQQHQANQYAFRSTPAPYLTFQNQSGPSSSFDTNSGYEAASRESSASSSTRGSEVGMMKHESDYDPFRIKHRRRTSPPQLKILEHHFEQNPKPDVSTRKELSEQLDMTPREVQVWFQNRRAKVKKLKERADRDAVTAAREGNSPPDQEYDRKSPNLMSASLPSNGFPVAQPYPSRTIYGQEVISQRRTSPPATSYPSMSYPPQPQAGPSMLPQQPQFSQSGESLPPQSYAPSGSYQSTIYTTTVASSTYATNEYLPPATHTAPTGQPHFPLLPHDHYSARRYSLPVFAGSAEASTWPAPVLSDPPATSDGYPPYHAPATTAFASSSLNASVSPSAIDTSQSSAYPAFPSYSFAPSSSMNNPNFHERQSSYGVSDSLPYESSTPSHPVSTSYAVSNSSSYIPSQVPAPIASDPFSSFDPLAPVPISAPPILSTACLLEDSAMESPPHGSRLLERRASMAQHRQANRLKPYDHNERRSPSGSHSPHSQ